MAVSKQTHTNSLPHILSMSKAEWINQQFNCCDVVRTQTSGSTAALNKISILRYGQHYHVKANVLLKQIVLQSGPYAQVWATWFHFPSHLPFHSFWGILQVIAWTLRAVCFLHPLWPPRAPQMDHSLKLSQLPCPSAHSQATAKAPLILMHPALRSWISERAFFIAG